jgi:hypothetical protein
MACKCIRKLMVVMMQLLIFILLKVQANDFSHNNFRPSSPHTTLHHFSQLDKVQTNDFIPTSFSPSSRLIMDPHSSEFDEVKGSENRCLEDIIRACDDTKPHGSAALKICIL